MAASACNIMAAAGTSSSRSSAPFKAPHRTPSAASEEESSEDLHPANKTRSRDYKEEENSTIAHGLRDFIDKHQCSE